MHLTRHAKNRLRYLSRVEPGFTERDLLELVATAQTRSRDEKGNARLSAPIRGMLITVVVDEARDVIVTFWREE